MSNEKWVCHFLFSFSFLLSFCRCCLAFWLRGFFWFHIHSCATVKQLVSVSVSARMGKYKFSCWKIFVLLIVRHHIKCKSNYFNCLLIICYFAFVVTVSTFESELKFQWKLNLSHCAIVKNVYVENWKVLI